jgi:Beta-1,3-glucanase/Carboxypeptidase regulatory-like domain
MLASGRIPVHALAMACLLPALARADITGKVVDASGKGIAGAKVALRKGQASALTASDGSYSIALSPIAPRPSVSGPGFPKLRAGVLEFRVESSPRRVRIEAFGISGRSAGVVMDETLAPGAYRADPFANREAGGRLSLLSVRIGSDAYFLKLLRIGEEGALAVPASSASPAPAGLRKAGAEAVDTLIASKPGYDDARKKIGSLSGRYDFLLVDPDEFWGRPSEYPAAANVMSYVFLNRTNGKYADSQIYWTFNGQTKTLAEQSVFDMPANASGRVTFHLESPTGKYWDFIEHTITATAWYGNTTRVDAYGLPLAIRLICGDGTDAKLGEAYDVFYMGREKFFAAYKAAVPAEFQHTADNGAPYRILAPGKGDGGFGPGEKYASYYDAYLKELGLPATDTRKVFACEGTPFGTDAQLAGAVNRHVAHLPKAEWAKAENFYRAAPANFYAKFFHDVAFGEKAYGFAYDDAAGYAAYTSCGKPKTLIIAVGF